ncbi:hypothetical protein ACFE04_015016 [Oxalis oulophora]
MELIQQKPTLQIEEEIVKVKNEDFFYENIEAPKFVDLSAPDRHRPVHDDRYWFCLRVGCDQKHEEEMDSEKIYKDFLLRVMEARSPNIRVRRALYRQENTSKNLKCPLTVPAKPSKSRISRLAIISSLNRKLVVDAKTPNVKTKQSAVVQSKALTTPRCKKRLSNPNAFRSVRNPKLIDIALPKSKGIAKALVFHSPKKTFKIKTSVELRSSVKKLCSEMKKLDIASGKKQLFPKEASRKQVKGREVKSRVFDSLYSPNPKRKEAKSSDKEIDTKSRNMIACLKKKHEEIVEALSESSRKIVSSSPSFCEENATNDGGITSEGSPEKENILKNIANEDKENLLSTICDDKTNEGEILEGDDKENCSASDENSQPNLHHKPPEKKKTVGKRENFKSIQKVSGVMKKPAKENSNTNSAAAGPQIVKQRKTKLTTPKPFRFRTDERGILKEASEKKHSLGEAADTLVNDQPKEVGTSSGLNCSKPVLMKKRETRPGKIVASLVKPGQQLSAIEENSTKIPRLKKAAKPKALATKSSPCLTPRSLSQERRRPATIPKEPNFHSNRKKEEGQQPSQRSQTSTAFIRQKAAQEIWLRQITTC